VSSGSEASGGRRKCVQASKEAGITVRGIEIDDLPEIFHLGETLFTAEKVQTLHRTWDEFEVVGLYQSDSPYCFVAENEEDKMVGFALGTIIDKSHSWKYGYLIWLGIHPDYQHAGVGQKLFKAFRTAIMEEGARIIMVDTEADNEGALKFFRKMGFNNSRHHIYLSMNVDQERKKLEERRQEREVRHYIEEHGKSVLNHD
jgi:ribosomal protein S18 acetylase RimI-like enzyme